MSAYAGEAARHGGLSFVGVAPERECFIPDGIPPEAQAPYVFAVGDRIDEYRAQLERDGYDPRYGFGTESSRPPDFDNPKDEIAYPFGVLYEGTSEYEDATRDEADFDAVSEEDQYDGEYLDYLDDLEDYYDNPDAYDDND